MKRKWMPGTIVLSVLLVATLSGHSGSVVASSGTIDIPFPPLPAGIRSVVLEETANNTLMLIGNQPDVIGKREAVEKLYLWDKERASMRMQAYGRPVSALSDYYPLDIYYSAQGSHPYGNGMVWTYYDNTHVRDERPTPTEQATIDGDTITFWSGTSPSYYSDQIELSESWKFHGLSVSVSVGSAGIGGNFQAYGDTVSWSSGWVNTAGWGWRLENVYSGVQGRSWLDLTSLDDSAMGSHRFGGHYVTVWANGHVTLPE